MLLSCANCGTDIFVFHKSGSETVTECKGCRAQLTVRADGAVQVSTLEEGAPRRAPVSPPPPPLSSPAMPPPPPTASITLGDPFDATLGVVRATFAPEVLAQLQAQEEELARALAPVPPGAPAPAGPQPDDFDEITQVVAPITLGPPIDRPPMVSPQPVAAAPEPHPTEEVREPFFGGATLETPEPEPAPPEAPPSASAEPSNPPPDDPGPETPSTPSLSEPPQSNKEEWPEPSWDAPAPHGAVDLGHTGLLADHDDDFTSDPAFADLENLDRGGPTSVEEDEDPMSILPVRSASTGWTRTQSSALHSGPGDVSPLRKAVRRGTMEWKALSSRARSGWATSLFLLFLFLLVWSVGFVRIPGIEPPLADATWVVVAKEAFGLTEPTPESQPSPPPPAAKPAVAMAPEPAPSAPESPPPAPVATTQASPEPPAAPKEPVPTFEKPEPPEESSPPETVPEPPSEPPPAAPPPPPPPPASPKVEKEPPSTKRAKAKTAPQKASRSKPATAQGSGQDAAKQHYRVAVSYYQQKKIMLAIGELKSAVKAYPKHAPSYRLLGIAYSTIHREKEAIQAYERFLRLDPSHRDAHTVKKMIASYRAKHGG